MVVGLSLQEWRVLLEKNTGSDKMQMISGVEEAVMRGLSQSEGTSDSQTDLKPHREVSDTFSEYVTQPSHALC